MGHLSPIRYLRIMTYRNKFIYVIQYFTEQFLNGLRVSLNTLLLTYAGKISKRFALPCMAQEPESVAKF